jgi:hypothetical protein
MYYIELINRTATSSPVLKYKSDFVPMVDDFIKLPDYSGFIVKSRVISTNDNYYIVLYGEVVRL